MRNMIASILAMLVSSLPLFVLAAPAAAQSNFVMQCANDERIARIVLRTDTFEHIHFIGFECRKGGLARIFKMGHETGTRHEIQALSPLTRIWMRRGTCANDSLANMERICALRFEFEDGSASAYVGSALLTGAETVIDLNGEIYGLAGSYRHRQAAAESGFRSLIAVSRKLTAAPDPEYRVADLLAQVQDQMDGVMGYAVVIRNPQGERVGFARGGWAIHPLDPEYSRFARQYDVHTMAAAGSTTKAWATAVAVLRLDMETGGLSLLDMSLKDALPARWGNLLHTRFSDVTVLDVIKHRAGFRHEGPDLIETGGEFPAWYRLRHGERWPGSVNSPFCEGGARPASNTGPSLLPAGSGPPYAHCYSNSAGGLFHYALAPMAHDPGFLALERELEEVPIAEYNRHITPYTARFYQEYVRDRILDPAGAIGSCDMSELIGRRPVALGYAGPGDFSGVVQTPGTLGCASGGWIISMDDLSRVLHAITNTGSILDAGSRAALFNNDDARRVWDIRIGRASTHNGARTDAMASVVIMPDGYVAAMAWSSDRRPAIGGDGVIVRAFDENRR